ncbi:MAG: cytochrome b N-terminal domain-containing protein [Planctomycetes bacterium]|nr:cytochrome b N-terminal domain-containing protein [Planctomycetota bacterium]
MTEPGDTSPEKIEQELMEEAQRELERRKTGKTKISSRTPAASPPAQTVVDDSSSFTVTKIVSPAATTVIPPVDAPPDRLAITSLYRIAHPGSPLSALVISGMLTALAIVAGSGIGLGLSYVPSAQDAHASVAWIQDSPVGALLRAAHFHGTNVLIYLSAMYLIHLLWSGIFRRPGQWVWIRALMVLALVLTFCLTGQLLPGDQPAVHGTAIRMSYLAEIPLVGPILRTLVQGGEDLGATAFVRFYAAHVMVLPALTLLLLRSLWRDGRPRERSKISVSAHALVILVITAAIFALAAPSPVALGLAGDLSEPFNDARPEWFALPFYQLLKLMPSGIVHTLVLAGVPVLQGLLLLALPWLERVSAEPARLRTPMRIALIAGLVALVGFAAWALADDMQRGEGYFAREDVEDIMQLMRPRNDDLNAGNEAVPATAYRPARDLLMLAGKLRSTPPKDLPEAQHERWRQFSMDLEAACRGLLEADSEAAQRRARTRIREACKGCHEAYEVKAAVEPRRAAPAAAEKPPLPQPDAGKPFFDAEKLRGKTVSADLPKPKNIDDKDWGLKAMNRMAVLCENLQVHGGLAQRATKYDAEQCLVDLTDSLKRLPAMRGIKKYAGDFTEAEWTKNLTATEQALNALRDAKKGDDFKAKFEALGKTCDGCHSGFPETDWKWVDLGKG